MKKLIILTCSLLIACTTAVKAHNDEPHRKKVGLVLAGGGVGFIAVGIMEFGLRVRPDAFGICLAGILFIFMLDFVRSRCHRRQ